MSEIASNAKPFVITVSTRALFDLEDSHRLFEEQGEQAYEAYQRAHEDEILQPGPAMPLVRKLLQVNRRLPEGATPVEVILLSRNSPETGMRVFNSLEAYGLNISRAVFTSGAPTSTYIKALDAQMFLSANPAEVRKAIEAGLAAATITPLPAQAAADRNDDVLRIAFDGDAVLFSDEAERVHGNGGLEAFHKHEMEHVHRPLPSGPFRSVLGMIHSLQKAFATADQCPVRTALVTARGMPAHKRAIYTLRDWGVRVDEAMFLGGRSKTPFLQAFGADLFLDDSVQNVNHAASVVPSGHVPFGVRNESGAVENRFSGGQDAPAAPEVPELPKGRPAPRPR